MVVCKFFLQGRCKFGDFCNFEHQINDNFNNYQNGTSILRQPSFGTSQPQSNFGTPQIQPTKSPTQASSNASTSAVDTATLVKSVVNDMTSAEKGGQWLLSCYAPFKEKPAFPGFEDQSFEELRFAHYEAMKSGSLEQYKQQVQLMIQQIQMKIKSLQNPSPDMVNLLKNIYDTPPSSQSGVFSGNLFNSPNTTSLNQQGTGFGQQQGTSIFAQANQNVFGKTQQQQTISQSSFGSTGTSIFGNTNQNSIFGGQTVTNNPFGASQPSPQTASAGIFGKNSFSLPSSGNSIFGGQQSLPQQTAGSIFGNTNLTVSAQTVPQQSSFGNQNVFGQSIPQNTGMLISTAGPQQTQTNIFAQPQAVQTHQAVIQNQQTSTNIFGGSAPQQNTTGSIFGQQTGVSMGDNVNSPFGLAKSNVGGQGQQISGGFTLSNNSVQPDESLYSKLEDLTEEEIKWFESDDLDIMKIPEKPPTYQMCFKT